MKLIYIAPLLLSTATAWSLEEPPYSGIVTTQKVFPKGDPRLVSYPDYHVEMAKLVVFPTDLYSEKRQKRVISSLQALLVQMRSAVPSGLLPESGFPSVEELRQVREKRRLDAIVVPVLEFLPNYKTRVELRIFSNKKPEGELLTASFSRRDLQELAACEGGVLPLTSFTSGASVAQLHMSPSLRGGGGGFIADGLSMSAYAQGDVLWDRLSLYISAARVEKIKSETTTVTEENRWFKHKTGELRVTRPSKDTPQSAPKR